MFTIIGVVTLAIALYLYLKGRAPRDIFRQFSLAPGQWTIVGSDLGKGQQRQKLFAHGVAGEPDTIFKNTRTEQLLIGEFKNRNYKGYIRRREYYQIILYIGLAKAMYGTANVVGVLSFRDTCIDVPFNQDVFLALVAMRLEVPVSLKNKRPQDPRPLHKRIRVAPGSKKIRFPS